MTDDKKLNIVLTQRDGWNFGLGFFAAALIFTVVVIPTLSCAIGVVLVRFTQLFS